MIESDMESAPAEKNRTRTVTVWILGGLGNQLFQYATGYALAKQSKARLRVDVSEFQGYARKLALESLGTVLDTTTTPNWARGFRRLRHRIEKKWRGQTSRWYEKERSFHWYELPQSGWEAIYLKGYWQSPKYFESVAETLRGQWDLSRFHEATLNETLREIQRPGSVSVHIRRGDYATNPAALATHGLLEKEYYDRAVRLIQAMVPQSHFHVFSDDPNEASKIAQGWTNVTVHPSRSQEHDLWLMSSCQHKILANSTFSWWGAWLSRRSGEIIAPRKWFARPRLLRTPVDDLYPEGWLLL